MFTSSRMSHTCPLLPNRERKRVGTTGTVPVLWAGHFQCKNIKNIFQIKYTEAILSNITQKPLWFEISKMLIAVGLGGWLHTRRECGRPFLYS